MDFKHKTTGLIYHVTNPALLSMYEHCTAFEKVEKKPAKPAKKTKQANKETAEGSLD